MNFIHNFLSPAPAPAFSLEMNFGKRLSSLCATITKKHIHFDEVLIIPGVFFFVLYFVRPNVNKCYETLFLSLMCFM